jgi:hypothetical protein
VLKDISKIYRPTVAVIIIVISMLASPYWSMEEGGRNVMLQRAHLAIPVSHKAIYLKHGCSRSAGP